VNTVELHREAMGLVDEALAARQHGNEKRYLALMRRALEQETAAADQLAESKEFEPTRSVLHRSAASIAVDCGDLPLAEKLICRGLLGNPPGEIADELRDLLEQVNFKRHLALRGVRLDSNEFQMSIAGGDVGLGIAPTDAFVDRVLTTEKLLYRTAERKAGRPYRERGLAPRPVRGELELYVSALRAGSLAVSFRMGHKDQMRLPGLDASGEVVDELLECLGAFNRLDQKMLKQRISDAAYYRNFVALARNLAPDGNSVKVVGFTTFRGGTSVEVSLTTAQGDVPSALLGHVPTVASRTVRLEGRLSFADALGRKHQIRLGGTREVISVPEGMMDDIVRPMWGTNVLVNARREGRKLTLVDIKPAPSEKNKT
jgi:hypothetical protein